MGSVGKSTVLYERPKDFDYGLFNKLPKKLQVQNVIDIGKDKTMDGTRYRALVQFEDGFQRSISEYTLKDFKDYLDDVLHKDRNTQY